MNCLVVDVGNTSTSVALARNGRISGVQRIATHGGSARAVVRAVQFSAGRARLDGAILSSVVPAVNTTWLRALRDATESKPLILTHRLKLGISVDYPQPATIGADRLANASGAYLRYGSPVIVADFGTALTFDVVSAKGAYIGGVIAPGLPLVTDYLADRTALLPRIRLTGACAAVGRSTVGAMRIGARIGYRGMVREITTELQKRLSLPQPKLCATGGYARWALQGSGLKFTIDSNLTLFGLSQIFAMNQGTAA